MALLPANPGGLGPKYRHPISVAALLGRGDVDAGAYSASDFGIEIGPGVPTHTLPGGMTRGLYLRTDGSATATLYLTVNGGTLWTAVAVP